MFKQFKLCIQRGGELQDHGTRHCRVTRPKKDFLRGPWVSGQNFGVVVAGQEELPWNHGIQSCNNVGESDLTTRGRGLEGVQLYRPARRQ